MEKPAKTSVKADKSTILMYKCMYKCIYQLSRWTYHAEAAAIFNI